MAVKSSIQLGRHPDHRIPGFGQLPEFDEKALQTQKYFFPDYKDLDEYRRCKDVRLLDRSSFGPISYALQHTRAEKMVNNTSRYMPSVLEPKARALLKKSLTLWRLDRLPIPVRNRYMNPNTLDELIRFILYHDILDGSRHRFVHEKPETPAEVEYQVENILEEFNGFFYTGYWHVNLASYYFVFHHHFNAMGIAFESYCKTCGQLVQEKNETPEYQLALARLRPVVHDLNLVDTAREQLRYDQEKAQELQTTLAHYERQHHNYLKELTNKNPYKLPLYFNRKPLFKKRFHS